MRKGGKRSPSFTRVVSPQEAEVQSSTAHHTVQQAVISIALYSSCTRAFSFQVFCDTIITYNGAQHDKKFRGIRNAQE